MKKILILIFVLPLFVKAQVPTFSRDTTYVLKALDAGVGIFRDAIYLPKLSSSDTALFVQVDIYGRLILRKFAVTDTQYLRRDININTTQSIANAAAIQQRADSFRNNLGIFEARKGGVFIPQFTFPFTAYQRTAIPYTNSSGVLTADSTKLSYGGDYITIGATAASINGILLNGGRAEVSGTFNGMQFNIGSGKSGGGIYDASKSYVFQNRGNSYLVMNSSAVTGGVNTADFNANVVSNGTVRTGGYTVATLPAAGVLGRMAYVTDASSPTYLGTLTGGGTTKCPVFDNGTAWVSH